MRGATRIAMAGIRGARKAAGVPGRRSLQGAFLDLQLDTPPRPLPRSTIIAFALGLAVAAGLLLARLFHPG